jgi:hypothetical protein
LRELCGGGVSSQAFVLDFALRDSFVRPVFEFFGVVKMPVFEFRGVLVGVVKVPVFFEFFGVAIGVPQTQFRPP